MKKEPYIPKVGDTVIMRETITNSKRFLISTGHWPSLNKYYTIKSVRKRKIGYDIIFKERRFPYRMNYSYFVPVEFSAHDVADKLILKLIKNGGKINS